MAQQQQGPRSQKPKPKAAAPVKTNKPAAKPGLSAQARREADLMKKYPGGVLVKNPVRDTLQSNVGGKSPQLEEVLVKGKATPKKPISFPKDSSSFKLPTLKAPEGKKMGRLRTAANDATSTVRGAVNTAFGKNQSQTTGGKILERGARLGATALGLTATGATAAPKIIKSAVTGKASLGRNMFTKTAQSAAKSRLGSLSKYVGAAGVLAPVAIGQMEFKNRTEDSKRRGIANPGKNNSLGINFDKPFQKKTAAADSSSKSKKK
jgi:hypothetical protein